MPRFMVIKVQNGYILYYGSDLVTQSYGKGYAFNTIKQLTTFLLEKEDLLK